MNRREVRISEVCQIQPPKSEVRSRLEGSDAVTFAPMETLGIDRKDLVGTTERPLADVVGSYTYFAENDVLLAKITPCFENGKLGIASNLTNGAGFGSSEYIVFRPSEQLIPKYLYYFLSQQSFRTVGAKHMTGTAGQKRITRTYVESCLIPIPSLRNQERIVTILDEAFRQIATAQAMIERNLKNLTNLFTSRLDGLFDSERAGWSLCAVEDLVNRGLLEKPVDGNHGEIHPTKAGYVETGIPFLMACDLANGTAEVKGCKFISPEQAEKLRTGFAVSGDVLLSHKGTIGRVATLHTTLPYVVLTPQVTYYRSKNQTKLWGKFLHWQLASPSFQRRFMRAAEGGSTRAYVGITRQRELLLSVPHIAEQMKVADLCEDLNESLERIRRILIHKSDVLTELKQSLMCSAFSGNL